LGAAAIALAGCEEHRQPAIQHAPEYLHEALAGDASAQMALVACLSAPEGCAGHPKDSAMACAWRGVRLASQSPDLSLSDQDAYLAACTGDDQTFRQRASVAQEDYTLRIYHRHAPTWPIAPAKNDRLYPSIETVRERVNLALGRSHLPLLPRFSAPQPAPNDPARIAWSSCAGAVCLEGMAPAFGGGLFSYKIDVNPAPDAVAPIALAPQLAAAGMDAPGIGEDLRHAAREHGFQGVQAGGVCWSDSVAAKGGYVASVSPAPCQS
jgi:hypothetical protein